jgi:hypothetical protein
MGVPTVSIVIDYFKQDALAGADEEGMNLRPAFTSFPLDQTGQEAIEKVRPMMDEIFRGLTEPLTDAEKSPQPKEVERLPRLAFKGDLEEINRFFYSRHWTDGLPIMPPTEQAVKEMLKGTSHSPEEVIGIMPPESWKTTVEGVAINGVMAGCKPNHMPVLLAQIEAFIKEPWYYNFVRSAGSYGIMQVVNGPIVDEIGMNYGINAMGPGNLPNMAIGRAFRMCIINQGGSLPGVNLMAMTGNIAARGFAFAENEKASPWEPYHVSQGFGAKESVVTLFGGEGGFRSLAFSDILKFLQINKHRKAAVMLMGPLTARLLVEREGFKEKKALQEWLWENAKISIREWRQSVFYKNSLLPNLGKPGYHPTWYADPDLDPNTIVHVFPDPEALPVIVVGGSFAGGLVSKGQESGELLVWEMGAPSSVSIDKWR